MKDEISAQGQWVFNEEVTSVFDDMLERSIPDYENMRRLVNKIVLRYQLEGTVVLDLGCSTGGAIKETIGQSKPGVSYVGLEISKPMLQKARENLHPFIAEGKVEIMEFDLKQGFPSAHASVVLSVLTLQFIPIEHRQKVIENVYDSLLPGGVFVLIEKILGENAISNQFLETLYYEMKGENGYTQEQIANKRKALEGVLVPVTSTWNEQLLVNAGFNKIQKFWQELNFAGWIGFKE